jgi:cytoskeletal protein CcmA (bactofilin family)
MFNRHSDRATREAAVSSDPSRNGALSPVPTAPLQELQPLTVTPASVSFASVVGRDDVLDGTFRIRHALRVFGRVTGRIESDSAIFIEEGAVVEADVTANDITIAGSYNGKLVCRERLEIRPTGYAKGELETVRLMLHEGGFIDGALRMQRPEPPTYLRLPADAPPSVRGMETVPVAVGMGARNFTIAAPTTRGNSTARPLDPVAGPPTR